MLRAGTAALGGTWVSVQKKVTSPGLLQPAPQGCAGRELPLEMEAQSLHLSLTDQEKRGDTTPRWRKSRTEGGESFCSAVSDAFSAPEKINTGN